MIRMSTITPVRTKHEVIYPESDGLPLAVNTIQFRWITMIKRGLDAVFLDAPDVFVAFGRPKGDRGSYQQWREGGIAPQTIFEIVSPGNTVGHLTEKFQFYDTYGVEEYYLYDPDHSELDGWLRKGGRLTKIK